MPEAMSAMRVFAVVAMTVLSLSLHGCGIQSPTPSPTTSFMPPTAAPVPTPNPTPLPVPDPTSSPASWRMELIQPIISNASFVHFENLGEVLDEFPIHEDLSDWNLPDLLKIMGDVEVDLRTGLQTARSYMSVGALDGLARAIEHVQQQQIGATDTSGAEFLSPNSSATLDPVQAGILPNMTNITENPIDVSTTAAPSGNSSTEPHRRLGNSNLIHGGDSRKAVNCYSSDARPYRSIVEVLAGGSGCTGVLVAPRFVLTAAHCIYKHGQGWRSPVRATWSRAWGCSGGSKPSISVVRVWASWNYVMGGRHESNHDWALLELASRPQTSFMAFGYRHSLRVGTSGFPFDLPGLRSETKYDADLTIRGTRVLTTLDTASGQSGSPLWMVVPYGNNWKDHGNMHAGFVDAVYGVLSGYTHWWPQRTVFARITEGVFVTLCTIIRDNTAHGEFNPCYGVV